VIYQSERLVLTTTYHSDDKWSFKMIGLICRIFGKSVKPEHIEVFHNRSEIITVATYMENGQKLNRVVRDSWKLVLSNETFELLFTNHPEKPIAYLDGKPVEPELANLCVECFYQSNLEKQNTLIKLIQKHKSSVGIQLCDFNIW
jgi:hypothetical protein